MNNHFYKLENSGNLPPIVAVDWADVEANHYIFSNQSMIKFLRGTYASMDDLVLAARDRRQHHSSSLFHQAKLKLESFGFMV